MLAAPFGLLAEGPACGEEPPVEPRGWGDLVTRPMNCRFDFSTNPVLTRLSP